MYGPRFTFLEPWDTNQQRRPLKGEAAGEPLQGFILLLFVYPGFSFLEPWAEISERLRRYVRRPLTPAALAKLANVCGVEVGRRAPAENEEEDNGKDCDVHQ